MVCRRFRADLAMKWTPRLGRSRRPHAGGVNTCGFPCWLWRSRRCLGNCLHVQTVPNKVLLWLMRCRFYIPNVLTVIFTAVIALLLTEQDITLIKPP